MPLSIDAPDEEPRDPAPPGCNERMCPLCSVLRPTRVCPTCGIDVLTRELVAAPSRDPQRPSLPPRLPGSHRRRLPPRSLPDLVRATAFEAERGWVGTLVILLWAFPFAAAGRVGLSFVLACVLSERARAALGSPVVIRAGEVAGPGDELGEPLAEPLRLRDAVAISLKAVLVALLATPLVSVLVTPARLATLREAGLFALSDDVGVARAISIATIFLTAGVVFLALRLAPGQRQRLGGLGSQPYDVLELLGSGAKGCLLLFALLGLCSHPLALLIGIPVFPVLAGALASSWEDLAPGALVHAARTTPGYGWIVLLSAGPLVALSALLGGWVEAGLIPGVLVSVALATLLGILAGIGRQDCEGAQLDRERESEPRS